MPPPAGYNYGGSYSPSRGNILQAIWHIGRGRTRSLARDSLLALRHTPAPPLVRGGDNLPERGPFVVVANHYERPGLWMAWPALLVSAIVYARTGEDVHWVAIEEWEDFRFHGVPVPPAVTRLLFERAFRAYGLLAMPPPAAPAAARAAAMRSAIAAVRRGGIIGLMPEGTVGPTPELLPARAGAGTFLALLAGGGAPVLPVGLYEEDGRLVAHFGTPFRLEVPSAIVGVDRDRWAGERVMQAVRDLLPSSLWGAYR